MATVAVSTGHDATLTYLEREWSDVPRLLCTWDTIAPDEQEDVWREWGMRDDALLSLRSAGAEGLLAAGEARRLRVVEELAASLGPLIAARFESAARV